MARSTSEPQCPERSRGVGTSMGRVTDPGYLRSRIAESSGPAGHNPGALYSTPYLGHMGQSRESCRPDKDDRNTTGGPTRERPPNGPRSMREVDDSPMTDVSRNARMFKLYINGAAGTTNEYRVQEAEADRTTSWEGWETNPQIN